METKDAFFLKKSAEVAIAAAAASADAFLASHGLPPTLTLSAGLLAAYLVADAETANERLLEWVAMWKENPEAFTEEVVRTEAFRDASRRAVMSYMTMRGAYKRELFRKIYLGSVKSDEIETFPLERLTQIIESLEPKHIAFLKDYAPGFWHQGASKVILDPEGPPVPFEEPWGDLSDDLVVMGLIKKEDRENPTTMVVIKTFKYRYTLTRIGKKFSEYIS